TGCLAQLLAGAFAQERDRAAVGRHQLGVWDPRGVQRFLDAAARVKSWAPFVAVADVQRGLLGVHFAFLSWCGVRSLLVRARNVTHRALTGPVPERCGPGGSGYPPDAEGVAGGDRRRRSG